MKNILVFIFLLLLFEINIYSQENFDQTTIHVIVDKNVELGKRFKITFEINSQNIKEFKSPDFKDFELIHGPYQSRSSVLSITNGELTNINKISYVYELIALKKGNYTIREATALIDNKIISSKPVNIKVLSSEKMNKSKEKQSFPIKLDIIAPDSIEIGKRFKIIFQVNTQSDDMILKNSLGEIFTLLSGPHVSTSSLDSISTVNKERVSIKKTFYTYLLEAQQEGNFTITPAEIIVNGKKYKSKARKIKVTNKNEYQQPQKRERKEIPNAVFVLNKI